MSEKRKCVKWKEITMSNEKMKTDIIDEMARSLCSLNKTSCEDCKMKNACLMQNCANVFYNKGYRLAPDIVLEAIDKFKSDIINAFISMCNYNDYNKVNLLQIGDTIDSIYDIHIAELKKKYTESEK